MIIVENSDPPEAIVALPQVTMFSKNPHSGRYGFFPSSATMPVQSEVGGEGDVNPVSE